MIVVTGALGFIGSNLVYALNQLGYKRDIVVVDDFYKDHKEVNLVEKSIKDWIHRDIFIKWLERHGRDVECVFHLGARTDTTLFDQSVFQRLNIDYSKRIWELCHEHDIHLIYASSAAVYGDGKLGFSDNDKLTAQLEALNPYGASKLIFDNYALDQKAAAPTQWQGFRFFNVYGPNEYHKGRMASVVYHGYKQIKSTEMMRLFKSHKDEFKDGYQQRDFIYINDVIRILLDALHHKLENGIYNLGTGKSRTFRDLINAVFIAMKKEPKIEYIDMPQDLQATYQYYTEADMNKVNAQISPSFVSLEDGVGEYVEQYLMNNFKIK